MMNLMVWKIWCPISSNEILIYYEMISLISYSKTLILLETRKEIQNFINSIIKTICSHKFFVMLHFYQGTSMFVDTAPVSSGWCCVEDDATLLFLMGFLNEHLSFSFQR